MTPKPYPDDTPEERLRALVQIIRRSSMRTTRGVEVWHEGIKAHHLPDEKCVWCKALEGYW